MKIEHFYNHILIQYPLSIATTNSQMLSRSLSRFRSAVQMKRIDFVMAISGLVRILMVASTLGACGTKTETETAFSVSGDESKDTNLEIAVLGRPGIDLAGPSGVPDGEPDLVIQVTLLPQLLLEIGIWDIEAIAGPNSLDSTSPCYLLCWTSAVNDRGWWLIKADLPERMSDGRSRIRLCFPGTIDVHYASALKLKGLDAQGALLFERSVALEADNRRFILLQGNTQTAGIANCRAPDLRRW